MENYCILKERIFIITVNANYRVLPVTCPKCSGRHAYFDEDRAEVFCAHCGLVLLYNPPWNVGFPALGGATFTTAAMDSSSLIHNSAGGEEIVYRQDYKWVEKPGHAWHGDQTKYRRSHYHRFVRVISTWFMMTHFQKKRSHYIINKISDFRKLHQRNDGDFLTANICFFAMEEDHRELDFDMDICKELKMTRKDYDKIKIKLFGIVGHEWMTSKVFNSPGASDYRKYNK